MKKILFIPVGGTICTSSDKHGMLSVKEDSGYTITSNFKNSNSVFREDIEFDITDNLMILSENMTVSKWNLMLNTYREHISGKAYDGVIFAHGTDTLAYSASLFSILLSNTDIPIFFVSANKSLDCFDSNGNDNFRTAAELICYGTKPGVYVTYKNISDGRMYIHSAVEIEQCKNYSEDFYSKNMIDISSLSVDNHKNISDEINKLLSYKFERKYDFLKVSKNLKDCILLINPYVGIRYDSYNYKNFDAVLHTTFHSGTMCTDGDSVNSVMYMMNMCENWKTDVYFSPAKSGGATYESIVPIRNCNTAHFMYGNTNEFAYAKLLVAYSFFENEKERNNFLNSY